MASEDFGRFSLDHQIPSFMFWLGAIEPSRVEASRKSGKPLPSLHSSLFEPLPEPTLRTGVKAMTTAVLELMKKHCPSRVTFSEVAMCSRPALV